MRSRDDVEATFYVGRPSILERALMRRLPGRRLRRLVDPIFIWRRHLDAWLREVEIEKYDAVHAATQVNALAFAELRDGPPFSVMIDQPRIAPRTDLEDAWFSQRALAAERLIFERADFIGSMSRYARDALVENYGAPPGKVHLFPPSVLVPDTPAPREGPGDLVNIAIIANDFQRKGGPALLRLHQDKLAGLARLNIVSRGFANPGGLVNVVHYPHIPNERIVDEFLAKMDIFCHPTRSDQSSWVCAEASAAGVPVVVTNVGGIADLCVDGETGFLIERDDAAALEERLTTLIRDPALRTSMGHNAHAFARKHLNAETNYGRLIDLIVGR